MTASSSTGGCTCPHYPFDTDQIVITASRAPEQRSANARPASPSSTSSAIERLGEPLDPCPAPADAVGRGRDLRARRIADRSPHPRRRGQPHPAVHRRHQDQRSRFRRHARGSRLLNADLASRIEVVRGPQSALVGLGRDRRRDRGQRPRRCAGLSARAPKAARSASSGPARRARSTTDRASLAGAVGWQRATGIDSFGGRGDKDGYRNLSGRLRGTWQLAPDVELGASAIALTGRSRVRRLRPVHLRPYRHARQQPQPACGRAGLGRVRQRRIAVERAGRRHRCSARRTATISTTIRITGRSGTRRTLDAQVERRFTTGASSTADRRRRSRARDLPRPRHGLRRLHRPGPQPRATSR